MIYQVTANLFFQEEGHARDFFHDCQKALSKATAVKADEPDAQPSTVHLLECRHDTDPNQPCTVIADTGTSPPS